MNIKPHAVAEANGRPLSFFMAADQIGDHAGAAALLDDIPKTPWLRGDHGYDVDWVGDALRAKGVQPCIPDGRSRDGPVGYSKWRYRRRSRIAIMFGRAKDWRRVAARHDRCPTMFFSAVAFAATVIFRLRPTGRDPRGNEQAETVSVDELVCLVSRRGTADRA